MTALVDGSLFLSRARVSTLLSSLSTSFKLYTGFNSLYATSNNFVIINTSLTFLLENLKRSGWMLIHSSDFAEPFFCALVLY